MDKNKHANNDPTWSVFQVFISITPPKKQKETTQELQPEE